MPFELIRVAVRPEGACGVLLEDGLPFAVTLERTFEGNLVKIPPGRYECKPTHFYRGKYPTYEVTGVEGHSRLLFHIGNLETDSDGCILVGQRYGLLRGKVAVLQSGDAFKDFMARTRGAFDLDVREVA